MVAIIQNEAYCGSNQKIFPFQAIAALTMMTSVAEAVEVEKYFFKNIHLV